MLDDEDIRIQPRPRTAFTPGPWEVSEGSSVRQRGGPTIAIVRAGREITLAASMANKRLIASAPELLVACQAALVELETYRCDVSEMEAPENVQALDDTITQVKTALARALGQPPA